MKAMAAHVHITELKDHLSEFLRRAEGGEEIAVLDGARPIVKIVPIGAAEETEPLLEPEEFLAQLPSPPARSAQGPADFADYVILEASRRAGCRAVLTFDRNLAKAHGGSAL